MQISQILIHFFSIIAKLFQYHQMVFIENNEDSFN